MEWNEIIGNDEAKHLLQRSLQQKKIANALLFHGSDGIGKGLFALMTAFHLMYPQGENQQALERMRKNIHPDLHIYYPEGKTAMHPISSMRNLIEQVFMAPFEAASKVFIIHDAERMLLASSNALLKTLEEPTLDSYIILLTPHFDQILPTIVSRCQKVAFSPLSDQDVLYHLSTKMEMQEARQYAALSYGSIGMALNLHSHPEHKKAQELLVKILSRSAAHYVDFLSVLKELCSIYSKDSNESSWHKEVDLLLTQILMWYSDLHSIQVGKKDIYFIQDRRLLEKQDLSQVPTYATLQKYIAETRLALDRNMKLYSCLEHLFLQLGLCDGI